VSASSEDDRTTSLQPHVITSVIIIISVGSILKHAVLKHFSRQLDANLSTSHRWLADIFVTELNL
jgi:hypothetical protein